MNPPPSKLTNFLRKFTVLRSAPRELWIVLAAYILENIAYKLSSSQVLPGWLKLEMGMGDETKGVVIGVWSALVTLFTVLVGSFTDVVGIRRTFLIGFTICASARLVMMATAVPWLALTTGLLPLGAGLALMTPVMAAAMRRYSTAAQRSVAFSLYYALMNLGYAAGDWIFDRVRSLRRGAQSNARPTAFGQRQRAQILEIPLGQLGQIAPAFATVASDDPARLRIEPCQVQRRNHHMIAVRRERIGFEKRSRIVNDLVGISGQCPLVKSLWQCEWVRIAQ